MNNPYIIAGKEADDEDDGDNDDNEDDDGDDSDTDTESDNKAICNELNEEIVELTSEISLKQKLIEELEMSQKRMASMKQQYEKKLMELNNRILHTQEERDKVLKNMGGKAALPENMNENNLGKWGAFTLGYGKKGSTRITIRLQYA